PHCGRAGVGVVTVDNDAAVGTIVHAAAAADRARQAQEPGERTADQHRLVGGDVDRSADPRITAEIAGADNHRSRRSADVDVDRPLKVLHIDETDDGAVNVQD